MSDAAVISKRSSLAVLMASGVVAVTTLLVTVISSRVLAPTQNAEFLVFWSFFNAVIATIAGLRNEATRAVAALDAAGGVRPPGVRVMSVAAVWGGIAAVVWVASAAWWLRTLLPGTAAIVVAVGAAACLAYAGQVVLSGAQAGVGQWNHYAGVNITEAVVRVALMAVVALVGATLESLQLAVAGASVAWLAYLVVFRSSRQAVTLHADVALPRLTRNGGLAMLSAAAYAVLVSGFAALLRLVVGDAVAASDLAVLVLAVMVTRAPVLMPLMAFQPVAISAFLRRPGHGLRTLGIVCALLVAGGAVVASLVGLVGPWLVRAIFGAAYSMSAWQLGSLTAAAVPLAMLTVSGSAVLAIGGHRSYSVGWVCAAVVTAILLFVPLALFDRVAFAMAIGPLCGMVPHLLVIYRHESASTVQQIG